MNGFNGGASRQHYIDENEIDVTAQHKQELPVEPVLWLVPVRVLGSLLSRPPAVVKW